MAEPPPGTWIFYGTAAATRPAWTSDLQSGAIHFWRHGLAHYATGGPPYSQQMRRGDTVLLLVGDELLATAILVGGGEWLFADAAVRRRWPIRIVDAFLYNPIPRAEIEPEGKPLVPNQGSVHPVGEQSLNAIRDQIARRVSTPQILPFPPAVAQSQLPTKQALVAALLGIGDILPDSPTASEIGWSGTIWAPPTPQPVPPPAPAPPPPEPEPAPTPAVGPSPEDQAVDADGPPDPKGSADATVAAIEPAPPEKEKQNRQGSRKGPGTTRKPPSSKAESKAASAGGKKAGIGRPTSKAPPDIGRTIGKIAVEAKTGEAPTPPEGDISLISDAPSENEDRLDRGPYALFLARRLHLIWCGLNGYAPGSPARGRARAQPGDTFILHVDAPWGGGKTTFANFLERVLQPRGERLVEGHFLYSSLGSQQDKSLADVFVPDFARKDPGRYGGARRPWIVAWYNAWRDQYVQPPWWQIFNTIRHEIRVSLWEEAVGPRPADHKADRWWRDLARRCSALWRWARVGALAIRYKLGNSKLRAQLLVWGLFVILLLGLYWAGILASLFKGNNTTEGMGKTVAGLVTLLGFGGVSVAALFNLISQSLDPDLDFSTEAKQIGIQDPINRFRATFEEILALARRPVLLVVDDIDRCDARTVVEVMRGFQTIVRSSRLFVLLLGDRAWIEAAHDHCHEDMAGVSGSEATLGSLFVRKMIQLSFRLPLMSRAVQSEYTRFILGAGGTAAKPKDEKDGTGQAAVDPARIVEEAIERVERIDPKSTVVARDEEVARITDDARRKLGPAGQERNEELLGRAIGIKEVAAASADPNREHQISGALAELFATLPNNPRQMKRIIMSFGLYENVGRVYFQYRRTPVGAEGALKAERWRQLARWVTLATEWPETWRDVAACPDLLDAAYGPPENNATTMARLEGVADAAAIVKRLRSDPMLAPLLGGLAFKGAGDPILATAVYEFNRIIWEPGFRLAGDLDAVAAAATSEAAPRPEAGSGRRRKNGAARKSAQPLAAAD